METFDRSEICLDQARVEEFCDFVYVDLDPAAKALSEQAPDLKEEIDFWAPDVAGLTHAKRLKYTINSNPRSTTAGSPTTRLGRDCPNTACTTSKACCWMPTVSFVG
jgi:hypothetical protein